MRPGRPLTKVLNYVRSVQFDAADAGYADHVTAVETVSQSASMVVHSINTSRATHKRAVVKLLRDLALQSYNLEEECRRVRTEIGEERWLNNPDRKNIHANLRKQLRADYRSVKQTVNLLQQIEDRTLPVVHQYDLLHTVPAPEVGINDPRLPFDCKVTRLREMTRNMALDASMLTLGDGRISRILTAELRRTRVLRLTA